MPYIKKNRRRNIVITAINAGELNFWFTSILKDYIALKGLSYQTINDILGALEGSKLEFYRRIVIPYENAKMAENGDVYTIDSAEHRKNYNQQLNESIDLGGS